MAAVRALLLAALVGLLAGCTTAGCYERAPWRGHWTEPGLYESLGATANGTRFSYTAHPAGGNPLLNATPIDAWPPERVGVLRVEWRGYAQDVRWPYGFFDYLNGAIRVTLKPDLTPAALEASFRTFVGAIYPNASAEEVSRLHAELARSREGPSMEKSYTYRVHHNLTPDLDWLIARFGAAAPFREEAEPQDHPIERKVGQAQATSQAWLLDVFLASRGLRAPGEEPRSLSVDAGDRASFGTFGGELPTPEAFREAAHAFFMNASLPPPRIDAPLINGQKICVD